MRFWKQPNPSTTPAGYGYGVTFSPDGTILAIANGGSPDITVYPWNDSTGFGTKFANPSTLPTARANAVAFSPDGTILAVAALGSPYISVYPWNNSTGFGNKFANPSTLPSMFGYGVAFSPDGTIIAVASMNSPGVSVYPWNNSTGFGNKFANPSTTPTGSGQKVAFSPDGTVIAVSHTSTPFVSVYPWNNSTGFGNKFANPSTLPAGQGYNVSFNADGTVIAVAHVGSPGVSVYPWNNSTGFGNKFANPSILPKNSGRAVTFNKNNTMIAVAHTFAPYISVYPWSNTTGFGTKLLDPITLPTAKGLGVNFSPNSINLALGHVSRPCISVYSQLTGTATFKGINVRQTGDRILFRESLKDSSGSPVTTGTTTLAIYELEMDGTLASYDFNDNTFKTTALSTATASMTHQTGNSATVNTGVWTYALTNVSGFTAGNVYISLVTNSAATPPSVEREFQFGGQEGDLLVSSGSTGQAYTRIDTIKLGGSATAGTNLSKLYSAFETGTAAGSTASSVTLRAGASAVNDYYRSQIIFILSGTGAGQTSQIIGYNGTTKIATVEGTWATQPDSTSTYFITGRIG